MYEVVVKAEALMGYEVELPGRGGEVCGFWVCFRGGEG
jgi:hypothetical protein